MAVKGTHNVLT